MAIESVTYNEGFRVKFQWRAGVRGTVIYCVPHGAAKADTEELMECARRGNLQKFNGYRYDSGTGSVSFAPRSAEMAATWIDIYGCDFDANYQALQHEMAGTYFNGVCKIARKIELLPIAKTRRAVRITVKNKSKFPIAANSIGYRVNDRVFVIPVALEQGQRKTLPQFDVGENDSVQLCQVEGGYPATFSALESE